MSDDTERSTPNSSKNSAKSPAPPWATASRPSRKPKATWRDAFVVLRKRGMASAAKKASRTTNEGAVGTYIHAGGKIGVLVELNCESDFVARTADFQELLRDIAMHIAATDPRYVSSEDVTAADLEREKDVYRAQAAATGKPANIIEKMLEGKLASSTKNSACSTSPSSRNSPQTIAQIIATKVAKLGENICVRRFARFKVGAPDWTVAQTKAAGSDEVSA